MVALTLSLPADFVLHIGAGAAAAAEGYLRAGLNPVVLAAAEPGALPALQALEQQSGRVRAGAAVVSAEGGPKTVYRCNFPDLSSLAKPAEALGQRFPGLQTEADSDVETLAVADLVKGGGLKSGNGLLVIEAPGQGLAILQALQQADCLKPFRTLRVQEGREVLYRGAPGLAGLQEGMEELGFSSWLEADPQDPERPYAAGLRNGAAMARAEALAGAQQQLDLCGADLAELQRRYGALLQQSDAQADLLRRLAELAAEDAGGAAAEPEE